MISSEKSLHFSLLLWYLRQLVQQFHEWSLQASKYEEKFQIRKFQALKH